MYVLNFSHPLTPQQKQTIEELSGSKIQRIIDLPVHFDNDLPFIPQLDDLMNELPLSSVQMQSEALLVNPPALNFITAILLAELHGRMGYFPPVCRMQPISGSLPQRFEVAEILNLQALRERARNRRYGG